MAQDMFCRAISERVFHGLFADMEEAAEQLLSLADRFGNGKRIANLYRASPHPDELVTKELGTRRVEVPGLEVDVLHEEPADQVLIIPDAVLLDTSRREEQPGIFDTTRRQNEELRA
jgi:hypothetical protein